MRADSLASPGIVSNGMRLRIEAAKAISAAEYAASRTPGNTCTLATSLYEFFGDCASAVFPILANWAGVGPSTRVSAIKATVDYSMFQTMDTAVMPASTAFTIAGGVVTSVEWGTGGDAGKVVLHGTGFVTTAQFTYTQPALNGLRSAAGVLAPSYFSQLDLN